MKEHDRNRHAGATRVVLVPKLQLRVGRATRLVAAVPALLILVEPDLGTTVVLLVGAVLLGRSFVALIAVDRGYDPVNLLTASIALPEETPDRYGLFDTLAERLAGDGYFVYAGARKQKDLDQLIFRLREELHGNLGNMANPALYQVTYGSDGTIEIVADCNQAALGYGLTSSGMAGGDHLHFSMLVHNTFVNPIEWWDENWIVNNISGKLELEP